MNTNAIAATSGRNSQRTTAMILTMLALAALVMFAMPAYAQGLEKVNTSVQKVIDTLNIISVGVVTIAVIFAGYKIAFQQARFMEVVPILIGGFLVGGAAQIAAFLIQ